MRRRRLIVIPLVLVLVVLVGGFAGDRALRSHRLEQQRESYAAGLDAARRADCGSALRLLTAAREGGSAAVASRAARERRPCEELQRLQARTADQAPAAALTAWLGYLKDGPPEPYRAIAQKAARTVVDSEPLSRVMTAPVCRLHLEMAEYAILTTNRSDPLAPEFLTACAETQAEDDPQAALRMYVTLRTRFPKVAANDDNVEALGQLVAAQLTEEGRKEGAQIVSDGSRPSLGGKARLIVTNGQIDALEMMLVGRRTHQIKVKACRSCAKARTDELGLQQCDRKGAARVTVTLPAGRYAWAETDNRSLDDLWVEQWNLKPNRTYSYCWWS